MQKHTDFLLSHIDTIRYTASEAFVRDSNLILWLDAIIDKTKKLPEYDERIKPEYSVNMSKHNDNVYVVFESGNIWGDPPAKYELEEWFGNRIVLNYKQHRFFIRLKDSSTVVDSTCRLLF